MHIAKLVVNRASFPPDDVYPYNLDTLKNTPMVEFTSTVTFFAGENGSGKSTLLKAIARRANIHIWQGFARSRYKKNRHEDQLYRYISLDWVNGIRQGAFFASEMFRNFSQLLDEWATTDPGILEYFGGSSLMTQSHGQSHMAYFEHRFGIPGIYLLDEPENALSPKSQLRLREVLKTAMGTGAAQFIIATHSPILLSLPGASILSFDSGPIEEVRLEDTDQYRVYRDFFRDQRKDR